MRIVNLTGVAVNAIAKVQKPRIVAGMLDTRPVIRPLEQISLLLACVLDSLQGKINGLEMRADNFKLASGRKIP